MNNQIATKKKRIISFSIYLLELSFLFVVYNLFKIYTENRLLTLKRKYRFNTYDEESIVMFFGILIFLILLLEWLRRNTSNGKKHAGFYNYLYIVLIVIFFILGGWFLDAMAITK